MSAVGDALKVAVALCKRFEGFSSAPYTCPAGVATIGYGNTFYEDGSKVTLQDKPILHRIFLGCRDWSAQVFPIHPSNGKQVPRPISVSM